MDDEMIDPRKVRTGNRSDNGRTLHQIYLDGKQVYNGNMRGLPLALIKLLFKVTINHQNQIESLKQELRDLRRDHNKLAHIAITELPDSAIVGLPYESKPKPKRQKARRPKPPVERD